MKFFAAFFLARTDAGHYALTTRPEGGKGLPGGKVEPGEDPLAAAVREAREEGWEILPIGKNPIQTKLVKGKLIVWFPGVAVRPLSEYKEEARGIRPTIGTEAEVVATGMGNASLF